MIESTFDSIKSEFTRNISCLSLRSLASFSSVHTVYKLLQFILKTVEAFYAQECPCRELEEIRLRMRTKLLRIDPHENVTDFCFNVPWTAFYETEDSAKKNCFMEFLWVLMRRSIFFPRDKVLRACQAMNIEAFIKSYPFVVNERNRTLDKHTAGESNERNGHIAISLIKIGDDLRFSLVVSIDNAKALLLFNSYAPQHLTYERHDLCDDSINISRAWKLGSDLTFRRIILSLRKNDAFQRPAMEELGRCIVVEHFHSLGFACFDGCSFGASLLLYRVEHGITPQLEQHAACGVIIDCLWRFLDKNEKVRSGHHHCSLRDLIRVNRTLSMWKKFLRCIQVNVVCVHSECEEKFLLENHQSTRLFSLRTIAETFYVYGSVQSDVVISRRPS